MSEFDTKLIANPSSLDSDDNGNDSEDEHAKPIKKQKQMADFFGKGPSQDPKVTTARKVSNSKTTITKSTKKDVIDLNDEGDSFMSDIPPPPPRPTAPRAARGATKKYVEIPSDDDGGDDSLFQDD
jgi:DNA topoisomerase II